VFRCRSTLAGEKYVSARLISERRDIALMLFEWDPNKNSKNIVKHGIDFMDAITIFDDDDRVEAADGRHQYGEERIQVIGEAKPGVLLVVYTWRHGATIRRIISARTASRKERKLYFSMKNL
jgi:uncharacterized DUF497 family protein